VAGFGSAKGTNEEAYLFQKLIRSAFGTHNVDHCTRLCHASSVAALMEGLGSGVVSNPLRDVAHADLVIVIGANPAQNHPVGASWIKNAVRRARSWCWPTRVAPSWPVMPGGTWASSRAPTWPCSMPCCTPSSAKGLANTAYIEKHTLDYGLLKAHVADFSPEAMAPVCGIEAATIREVARAYATSRATA
jgi:formate dehydrogenase major subunit